MEAEFDAIDENEGGQILFKVDFTHFSNDFYNLLGVLYLGIFKELRH